MIERQPSTLAWGVKQSFRAYVEAAGGTIETGGGAERDPDGAFIFAAAPGDGLRLGADGRLEGVGGFVGEVRFDAHGGMLKVFMADPAIEIGEGGAVLTVWDTPSRTKRVALAQLDLAAMTKDADGAFVIPTTLAKDGWQVLGDNYPRGTVLDAVWIRLGL
jgi:hypothetical protein